MKKFYWKEFIKKMKWKNFIELIVILFITVISTSVLFEKYGLDIVIQSFVLSYLYDKFKELKEAIVYANKKYTIEEN